MFFLPTESWGWEGGPQTGCGIPAVLFLLVACACVRSSVLIAQFGMQKMQNGRIRAGQDLLGRDWAGRCKCWYGQLMQNGCGDFVM